MLFSHGFTVFFDNHKTCKIPIPGLILTFLFVISITREHKWRCEKSSKL